MANIKLNSVPMSVFKVDAKEPTNDSKKRADIVASGRLLAYEHARKGTDAMNRALKNDTQSSPILSATEYKELNERFQADHLLYAASKVCAFTDRPAPKDLDEFRKQGDHFYGNAQFYMVLQGIYEEIVTPILPAVYSEAVSVFADVVSVGFAETYALSVGSNDIPIFQDSAWGAGRSVPANRFYAKDYVLNPQPKTAEIRMKWTQLVGNNVDFGQFFANLAAGMYAKTLGMWNAHMAAAISDTTLVPSGLTYSFSSLNWVTLANKLAALNGTSINNIIAHGNAVALAKVLPYQATGSTNVNMDAALATLLGRDYLDAGYLGEFMNVRLLPLTDAVVPNTQNGAVTTVLDSSKIYLMSANGRKPMTIAYNEDTPLSIEISAEKTASFEMIFNLTFALDAVSVFSSKVGVITVS